MNNLLDKLPSTKTANEIFETLIQTKQLKLERIISTGQITPENQWYNQAQNEWVVLIKGRANIVFEDQREVHLVAGDYLHIHKHQKHRVSWTDPNDTCVWLALHYDD